MKYFFQNLKNTIDFVLRQNLKFSKGNYSEQNEEKEGLFCTDKLIDKEKCLFQKYDLNYLKSNSTKQNYLENLYLLDLLDRYLEITNKERLNVLDIGCKNWFYARGEYSYFKKHCKNLFLDGVELDPNRIYSNLYTRAEVAKFYTKNLDNINYISDDFLKLKKKYDYIIWILPFVFSEPLLEWGLPDKYFQPEKMLVHAYNSLNKDGNIFIINQGEHEYEAQKTLCEKSNITYIPLGEVKSEFLEYKNRRYAILIKN